MSARQKNSGPVQKPRGTNSPIVGFRLDTEAHSVLAQRAALLGVSAHELARYFVLAILAEGEERNELRESVDSLQTNVEELRQDLAMVVEVLLVTSGKVSESAAREWVKDNLQKK